MTGDEDTIAQLVKAVAKLGRVNEDSYHLVGYITAREHNLSNETYTEILKAVGKLRTDYGKEYEGIVRFLNKVPTDTNGAFTEALVGTLIKLGKPEDISYLDKYMRNYNRVNEFANKGQVAPQIIKDTIAKVIEGIRGK